MSEMKIWGLMIMSETVVAEKYYMAALGNVSGIGNKSIEKLLNFLGSAKVLWTTAADELIQAGIIRPKSLEGLVAFRNRYSDAPDRIFRYCERHGFNLCSIFDEDYPPLLKEIDSPPMFFYYRGKLQPSAQRIGIVGSRDNSPHGRTTALELGEQIAAAGFTVVSGAARGIDTFAHRGALKTGRTVAVLGCGIEVAFNGENKKFFEEIAESGIVLSEFYPTLLPQKWTLVRRNRIIAGLSRGVIVVEADLNSGTLITSDYAFYYGRDIFAVTGSLKVPPKDINKSNVANLKNNYNSDSLHKYNLLPECYARISAGCDKLIRNGAIPIESARDVLSKYRVG
mgnify:CR=1 FL=1